MEPMLLPTTETVPSGPGWRFELKNDGIRCLARADGGAVSLWSRHGRGITRAFPEVTAAIRALGRGVLLDGEMVVAGAAGSDFEAVMARLHGGRRHLPATLVAFDLLALDGTDLCGTPLDERQRRLAELPLRPPALAVNPSFRDGEALWSACRARGLDGIVCKRGDSLYHPGRRSPDWLKLKNWRDCETWLTGILPGGDVAFRARVGDYSVVVMTSNSGPAKGHTRAGGQYRWSTQSRRRWTGPSRAPTFSTLMSMALGPSVLQRPVDEFCQIRGPQPSRWRPPSRSSTAQQST